MKYNKLGTTDIKVSSICLGTMTWGFQNTQTQAHEQINLAREYGINFMDTAEIYAVPPTQETYGKTEEYIGGYFKKFPTHRKDWILASKVAGPGVNHIRNAEGFTDSGIVSAVEGSLKRLNTDYIDLYQLHWPQRQTPRFGVRDFNTSWFFQDDKLQETLFTLGTLKSKGLIREIGLSNENAWGVMKCLSLHHNDSQIPRIQSVQNVYNLVSRSLDTGLSEVLVRANVSLLPYSPLAGGLLSGKYQNNALPEGARFSTWGKNRMTRYINSNTSRAIEKYCKLANTHNMSPTELALSFVNSRSYVTSNIIGATTPKQLTECIKSVDITLSSEILQKIEEIHYKLYNPSA